MTGFYLLKPKGVWRCWDQVGLVSEGSSRFVVFFVAVVDLRSDSFGRGLAAVAEGLGSVLAFSAWSAPGNSPALASVTTLLRGTSGVQPRDSEQ